MSSAMTLARAMETNARHHGRPLLDIAMVAACMADPVHVGPADMLARELATAPVGPEVWGRVAELLTKWSRIDGA